MALVTFVVAAIAGAIPSAQVSEPVRQRFEAGRYDDALQVVAAQGGQGVVNPADEYLATQILVKLSQHDRAKAQLAWLIERPDVWRLVAQAATALIENDANRALTLALQSVAENPNHFFAQYQLGLVYAHREDWTGAASSFDRASKIDPSFAYAHYYAGLSYSRIKRADQTAIHFEAFLKLAPKAPERPAVESIMRTLRGR